MGFIYDFEWRRISELSILEQNLRFFDLTKLIHGVLMLIFCLKELELASSVVLCAQKATAFQQQIYRDSLRFIVR